MEKESQASSKLESAIAIYQTKNGAIKLRGDYAKETVWGTQAQIAEAFDVDIRTINEHIKNIYKSDELSEKTTIRKFRIVQKEGKRNVQREINHYNLDLILSIGYRVNSKKATKFRQWATKTLHEHIIKGYTLNHSRIEKNYTQFLKAIDQVKSLVPSGSNVDTQSVLDIINLFANTWLSLDAYDKQAFDIKGLTKKKARITAQNLSEAIGLLRSELIAKKEASDLFAKERTKGSIDGIVGNVMQSFNNSDVYPTVEEKAAHLLYF